jgi:hypothetical protein
VGIVVNLPAPGWRNPFLRRGVAACNRADFICRQNDGLRAPLARFLCAGLAATLARISISHPSYA